MLMNIIGCFDIVSFGICCIVGKEIKLMIMDEFLEFC